MPDTRGRALPSEILSAIKDPSVQNWLKNFIIAQSSSMSIGRYPGNGSAQDDQYVYPDDADSTHPYNFDYVIPSNFQRLVSAKLSFKIRPYRTYSTFSPGSTTGTESATHTHAQGNGSTSTDSTPLQGGVAATNPIYWPGSHQIGISTSTGVVDNITTSGHNHAQGTSATESATHTHSMSGSSVLGIVEDSAPVNPGITVAVDGTDVTAVLGGPFNSDQVEVDVTQVLKTAVKAWHTLSLQPNQRVRLTGILRISYYNDSRLAQ